MLRLLVGWIFGHFTETGFSFAVKFHKHFSSDVLISYYVDSHVSDHFSVVG